MDPVIAGERRQAEIGDDEPLRGQRGKIVARIGILGRRNVIA
jgi:hypothetical protein